MWGDKKIERCGGSWGNCLGQTVGGIWIGSTFQNDKPWKMRDATRRVLSHKGLKGMTSKNTEKTRAAAAYIVLGENRGGKIGDYRRGGRRSRGAVTGQSREKG